MGFLKTAAAATTICSLGFLLLTSISITAQSCDHINLCRQNESMLDYPFWNSELQPDSCGHPGFEVYCDRFSRTILKLQDSVEFTVQSINYYGQEICLNDPNGCLPKKLLSLNLSGSPYESTFNQNNTFFNCSSVYYLYQSSIIYCLSGSSYKVISNFSSPIGGSSCELIKEVTIPIQTYLWSPSRDNLCLKWVAPDCKLCELKGRPCTFVNPYNGEKCLGSSNSDGARKKGNTSLVIIASVLCLLALSCYMFAQSKRLQHARTEEAIEFTSYPTSADAVIVAVKTGLDSQTLESFPTFVLGDSRRETDPNDDSCSICMCEYKSKEIVKTIPECNHCFHIGCI